MGSLSSGRRVFFAAAFTLTLAAGTAAMSGAATATTQGGPARAALPTAVEAGHPLMALTDGTWLLKENLTDGAATSTFAYGNPGDYPVTGDWNGDGTHTVGVVRGYSWFLRNTNTTGIADISFDYGNPGDQPIAGDWNGDGKATAGVVRGYTWYLRNTNTTGIADVSFGYGNPTDTVIVGDWDGNGTVTPGVVRNGLFYLRNSNTTGVANTTFAYGNPGDQVVIGDWDGNGTYTPGVVRPDLVNGGQTWYLRNSNTTGVADVVFNFKGTGAPLSTSAGYVHNRGGGALRSQFVGRQITVLPTSSKVVGLTFDEGANADGVSKILTTLQNNGVPATFFMTGAWARSFPQFAASIGLRYPVGNHTNTHANLTTLTDAQIRAQILGGATAVQSATRYDTHPMFRFPFGASNAHTLSVVNSLGYASINWTVDTLGWQGTSGGQSTATVRGRVLANLRPGEIILMHVGSNPTDHSTLDADALQGVINDLKAEGYGFVVVPSFL